MGRRLTIERARCAIAVFLVLGSGTARAQEIAGMEFHDAPIASILVALGRATGNSVVPDETVRGRASYYFANTDFETALDAFASRFDLFVTHHERIYTVSAVSVEVGTDGQLTVRAPNVPVTTLLGRISEATGVPVLYERLPTRDVTYFAASVPLERILEQLAEHLPDHTVRRHEGAFLLAHRENHRSGPAREEWLSERDGRYALASEPVTLDELLSLLFAAANREYQLLTRGSALVPRLTLSGHSFDELLRLVLEQADAGFAVYDGIYYIVDAPPASAAARGLETRLIPVRTAPVERLLDLLPSSQLAGVTLGHNREANLLSATGTPQNLDRVTRIISELDRTRPNATVARYELQAINAATLASILPDHLAALRVTPLPGGSTVLVAGAPDELAAFERFLELADESVTPTIVELEHITAEELIAHLPPGLEPARVWTTADPRRVLFRGTPAMREQLTRIVAATDRPTPQVRYHVLVLQVQAGHATEFDVDLGNRLTTPESQDAFLANLGNLLSLEFDVVSAFGYQFAARLNASIGETRTSIVADTSLVALSGETTTFRNTSTFRYRDMVVDPESGEQRSTGVIREIQSGLILEITGAVAGNAVVMDITATISRRGTDGEASGNPPPTSERVVRTRVRTASGEPLVVSGLRLDEREESVRKTPLLGDIPLLGLLFRGRRSTNDRTELAVYIVPYLDRPERAADDSPADIYRRIFEEADE